ncbi:Hypothetical protein BOM_1021 (plasmid) [Borrelia miyamotoi FR64b]|uniref:Uncharacterized protein n=1 Tax=Borrelia miyamotoi FR64b TaxID=1292392 RepID=W5SEL9_9SPIR|nr:DUF777 family protein [Borrelia miyamotoi]AHH05564.1 Hypothetical protein BOM_1021 [Borrelia miyamotoi FR64b]WAZ71029.1 DUF777 family protein [Borrelia miyamotoi]
MVLLLQSNINLFNQDDDINFDKNHFYILSIISPKYLEMACNDIALKATHKLELKSNNQIDIYSGNTNINANHNININCNDLNIKANDDTSIITLI